MFNDFLENRTYLVLLEIEYVPTVLNSNCLELLFCVRVRKFQLKLLSFLENLFIQQIPLAAFQI